MELTREQQIMFDRAKITMMSNKNINFLASIVYLMEHKFDSNLEGLAGMSGNTVTYNPDLLFQLPMDMIQFVMLHEARHLIDLTAERAGDLDPDLWNEAADHVINLSLKNSNIPILEGVKADKRFERLSAEDVYKVLLSEQQQQSKQDKGKQQSQSNPSDGDSQQDGGQGSGSGDPQDQDQNQDSQSGDQESQDQKQQQQQGQGSGQQNQQQNQQQQSSQKPQKRKSSDPLSNDVNMSKGSDGDAEGAMSKADWGQMMANAQALCKQAGTLDSVPAEIQAFLDELYKPKIPTKAILNRYLNTYIRSGYNWNRPNRKFFPQFYVPTRRTKNIKNVAFFFDTSGSVTDEDLQIFFNEMAYALRQNAVKELTVVQFDTSIRKVDVIRNFDDLNKLDMSGRGGTCIGPVLQWIEEHKPEVSFIYTDGWFSMPEFKPKSPLIWCIFDNPNWMANFGKVIHYEK